MKKGVPSRGRPFPRDLTRESKRGHPEDERRGGSMILHSTMMAGRQGGHPCRLQARAGSQGCVPAQAQEGYAECHPGSGGCGEDLTCVYRHPVRHGFWD
ncbi:MAG: hypothetical protein AB1576_14405 [Bacillota bacterium]